MTDIYVIGFDNRKEKKYKMPIQATVLPITFQIIRMLISIHFRENMLMPAVIQCKNV